MSLFPNTPAVPTADSMLSLKMLSDINPIFKQSAEQSTHFLAGSLALLQQDDYLKLMFGENNISAAMKLAPILKAKTEELHANARFNSAAQMLGQIAFTPGVGGLNPNLEPKLFQEGSENNPIDLTTDDKGVQSVKFNTSPNKLGALNLKDESKSAE